MRSVAAHADGWGAGLKRSVGPAPLPRGERPRRAIAVALVSSIASAGLRRFSATGVEAQPVDRKCHGLLTRSRASTPRMLYIHTVFLAQASLASLTSRVFVDSQRLRA